MSKNYVTSFRGENNTPNDKFKIKDEPETPIHEDFGDHNHLDFSFENDFGSMRRSMSMNDIAALREDIMMGHERSESYCRQRQPSGQHFEHSKTRFVSMAEAIYHFQRDTPNRFHSSRPRRFQSQGAASRTGLTKPQSPILRCIGRSRPPHVMSQKEKEELELEEIKKHQIKAHPISKSVIEGTINLPEVTKKPNTIPEPFNLTEMQKKLMEPQNEAHIFKARPAPKHILEKPHIPVKPPVQLTKPISPKFHYIRANSEDQFKNNNKPSSKKKNTDKVEKYVRHGPVKPEPFSFEKRDEELKKRKEERIRRQIEEEKKQASLFKAQPLPGAVKKRMNCVTTKGCSSSTSSENKENYVKFEARPPTVLYKEPFKPFLQTTQIMLAPFDLTTEKRAADRDKFEKQLKEKEEEQERMRQQREKEQQEAEQKAQAELRATMIHHPKPVPANAPFVPERSGIPLTVPETPTFVRRLKQHL